MTFIDNEDENPFKLQPSNPVKPVLAQTDLPKNPFGTDPIAEDQKFRANASLIGNRDASPDEASKTLSLGKQHGVPPELIEVDPKAWEKKLKTDQNINIANSNPAIQSYLANNPFGAQVSKDDLPQLDAITKFIRDSWKAHEQFNPGADKIAQTMSTEGDESIAGAFMRTMQPSLWGEAIREGYSAYQYGALLERYRTGDPATRDKLRPQIEAYELEQQSKPQSGANYVQNLLGGLLGQTGAALPELLTYTTAGATTGIAYGALGGPGGAAGGLFVGGAAGLAYGFSVTMAQGGAGHIYRSVEGIEGLSETTKQALSLAGGLVVGTLAAQGGALVQKGIGELITKFASDKAGQVMLSQFMVGTAKYAGEAAAINGGQVLAQLIAEQIGKQMGDRDLKTIFKLDKDELSKFFGEVGQAMVDGAVLGSILHLPAAIPGRGTRMGDVIIANRTIANANRLDKAMEMAQASDTKRLSPDLFAQALKQDAANDPTLFIDTQAVRDNFNAFSFIDDLDKQMADATALGTEIKVQQSDMLAYLDPKVYVTIREKIRQGGADLTVAEAQATLLAQQKAAEADALRAQAVEAGVIPPADAVPPAAMGREELIAAIWGDQATEVPTARPAAPTTVRIPGAPPVELPASVATRGRELVNQLLGRREVPTLDEIQARIVAENEARIRANIRATMMPPETPMQQAQSPPTVEALSVPGAAVTEQTKPSILETPSAETVKPVVDADAAMKKEVKIGWPRMLRTLVERLKDLSEATAPADIPDAIIAMALQRNPGNLAEFRTFINDEARLAGIKDPIAIKDLHDRADAAAAALGAKLIKNETSGIVHGMSDADAKAVAIATAQQIDSTRHIQWLRPLLESSKTSSADRAAYNQYLLDLQEALSQSVLDAANEVVSKKMTRAWKDDSAAMRPDVVNDIARKPVIMADEFFRTGEAQGLGEQKVTAKLAREEVDTMFTPEELKAMGVKGKLLSRNRLLTTNMFGKGESVMPADMLATAFGYKDGKSMMKELIEFRQSLKDTAESPEARFQRLVDEEVASRMVAEHGNLDLIIAEHARIAAHSLAQEKVFKAELKVLSKLSGKELAKHDDVKKLVREHMDNMKNSDASNIEYYENIAGVHGKNAQQFYEAGDYSRALDEKQLQVKAELMARQAIDAGRDAKRLERMRVKYGDKPRVEAVAPHYNTWMMELMRSVGLDMKGRSPETLARDVEATGEKSYSDWAKARHEAGETIPTLSFMEKGPHPTKTVAEMTVANSRELLEALRTLEALGKTADEVQRGNQVKKVDEILAGIKLQLEPGKIGERYTETDIPKRSTIKTMFAELLKVDTIVRKTDRLLDNGLMDRYIMRPIKDAQDYAWRLTRRVNEALKNADHGEWTLGMNRLNNLVPNKTILDKRGNPLNISRGNLLMMALYWGTEQGRILLANTLHTEVMTLNDFILDNMTRKNWNFVQNIWRTFDDILVPEMDKVYRQQRGFGMEPPDAITFSTKVGGKEMTLKGGYMPFIQERRGTLPTLKEAVVFDNRLYDSLPSNSQRALMKEGKLALSLDFDQLAYRIKEHIHSVSYREPIRNVAKIIDNPEFTTMMREAWGDAEASLFKPWLRDIANDGGRYQGSVAHGWQWFWRSLLKNAIQTFTGYNLATASIHSPSAAVNTFGELRSRSFKAVAAAIGDSQLARMTRTIFMSPENAEKYSGFAWANSVELRSRWRSSENDIRKSLGQWSRRETLNYYAEWWGQSIISYTDYMTATVAWHGGYQKAMEAGLGHEAAVAAGDKLVRAAHGASAIADKSEFHRERNVQQFSAFYGFFNHVFNQMHLAGFDVSDTARAALNEKSYTQMGKMLGSAAWKGFAAATFYAIAQSYNHHLVRGEEKEDATAGEWMTNSLIGFGTGMIPGVRESAFAASHAWSIAQIPVTSLLDIPRRWKRDTTKWANQGGPFPVRTSIELAGAAGVRIGARQIARWAEEMQKIMNGDTPPPSDYMEWQRLFIYGHSRPIGTSRGGGSSDPLGLGSGPGRNRNRGGGKNPFGL